MEFNEPTINITAIESRDGLYVAYELDAYIHPKQKDAQASKIVGNISDVRQYLEKLVPQGFSVVSRIDKDALYGLSKITGAELLMPKDGSISLEGLNDGNFNYFRPLNHSEKHLLSDIAQIQ